MATLPEVERRYACKLPAAVKALYEKRDGERAGSAPWRLQSTAELLEIDLDEAYLDHSDDGKVLKKLGPLVPLFTNDGSDLLVLHVGGPLDGRLSLVLHDDSSIVPAFRSVESFLKKRQAKAFEDGELENFDYVAGDPKPAKGAAKADDERAAAALEKALARAKKGSHAAEFAAETARLLRGEPLAEDTSAFPTIWPHKEFISKMRFTKTSVFATVTHSTKIEEWSLETGKPGPGVKTKRKKKDTARFALVPDGSGLFEISEGALWKWTTEGKRARTKVFDVSPSSDYVGAVLADGRLLIVDEGSDLQIWSAAGKLEGALVSELNYVHDVIVGPGGKPVLLVGLYEADIMRVDLAKKQSVPFAKARETINAASQCGPAHFVYAYGEGAESGFCVADITTGKVQRDVRRAHDGRITGIAMTPSGFVVTASEFDNSIRTFDAKGKPVGRVDLERPAVVDVGPGGRVYVAFAYRGIGRYDIDAKGALTPVRD